MDPTPINWMAVLAGTVLAYGLGMIWFSPMMFGKAWSTGSHNIQPPDSPPMAAMAVQLVGTFLMALAIGMTETFQAFAAAITLILAASVLVAGMDLFSQKTGKATVIDAGYILACGVIMIAAQAIL